MRKTINRIRETAKTHRKKLFTALCILSVLELIFVTATGSLKQIIDAVPEAVFLSVLTEVAFAVGILLMAVSSERSVGINPLKWRSHLNSLIKDIRRSRMFMIGFWLNFMGALGTGVIWLLVILLTLPPSGWLLVWLPVADIILTFAVRKTFADLISLPFRRKKPEQIDNSEDSHTI